MLQFPPLWNLGHGLERVSTLVEKNDALIRKYDGMKTFIPGTLTFTHGIIQIPWGKKIPTTSWGLFPNRSCETILHLRIPGPDT